MARVSLLLSYSTWMNLHLNTEGLTGTRHFTGLAGPLTRLGCATSEVKGVTVLAGAMISHGATAVETFRPPRGTLALITLRLAVICVISVLMTAVVGPSPPLPRRFNVPFAFVTHRCMLPRLAVAPRVLPLPTLPREGGWTAPLPALPWTPPPRVAFKSMPRPRLLTTSRTEGTFQPGDGRRSGCILLFCTPTTLATPPLDTSFPLNLSSAVMVMMLLEPCKPLAAGCPTPPTAR